mgnify:CR=1 FL=1
MREALRCNLYVLGLVVHEGRFLAVRERKHGQLWYFPAGGLEAGESIERALARETLEEAGVHVRALGVARVEEQWFPTKDGPHGWYRFLLRAEVVGDPTPKSTPDEHSLEARWILPSEIGSYTWRGGDEVVGLVRLAFSDPPLAALALG